MWGEGAGVSSKGDPRLYRVVVCPHPPARGIQKPLRPQGFHIGVHIAVVAPKGRLRDSA